MLYYVLALYIDSFTRRQGKWARDGQMNLIDTASYMLLHTFWLRVAFNSFMIRS
uniref:Uncharacterized protein n=1 Tax=Rhizophora mucronata TaxID=61149 RepID=A0A2P2LDY5_RHIMU